MNFTFRTIVLFFGLSSLASCHAVHHGSMLGTSQSPDYYTTGTAIGTSGKVVILFWGGLSKEALVYEAKKNLLENTVLEEGQVLDNFTVDFREANTMYVFYRTTVTVSADIRDAKGKSVRPPQTFPRPQKYGFTQGEAVVYMAGKDGTFEATIMRFEKKKVFIRFVDQHGYMRIKPVRPSALRKQ